MTILLALAAATTSAGLAVLATVRRDGLGSRPGPRSHHDPFPVRPGRS